MSTGSPRSDAVDLSIVIPCLDAARLLPRQLDALATESATSTWEVVVVDNGSTDDTSTVARGYLDRLPSLRVVHEPQRGRHHACDRGVAEARGRSVAFVDADDRIEPGFVDAMAGALADDVFVAGRLVHHQGDEALVGWGRAQDDGLMPSLGFLPYAGGGNLGIRREVFEAVDGFRSDIPFGEDADLSWRVQLAGHPLRFAPGAAVDVFERDDARSMFTQHRRFGIAQALLYAAYRDHGMPRRSPRVVARDWVAPLLALPAMRDRDVRFRALRRFARNIGRLQGSVRARVLYL